MEHLGPRWRDQARKISGRPQRFRQRVAVLEVLEAHDFLVAEREHMHDVLRDALAAWSGDGCALEQHDDLVCGAEELARLELLEAQTFGDEAEDIAADG